MTHYIAGFAVAFVVAFTLTPLFRRMALALNIVDHPSSAVKTHRRPVPYLGGLGLWAGFVVSLAFIRLTTQFPTGTLHDLRGILLGAAAMVILGLVDDLKPLGFRLKFLWQFVAAILIVSFDIRLYFIKPDYVAVILTVLWVVGITNALNLVDIMDGLSAGLALICSLAFLFIALPTEKIYVNFASCALAGACAGFLPHNFPRAKIFMGDTGSLFLGFTLAAISLGAEYTRINDAAIYAPLLILGIPLYETIYVMWERFRQDRHIFMGSKDHVALRLEASGLNRVNTVLLLWGISITLSFAAWWITVAPLWLALTIYAMILACALVLATLLSRIKMQ